MGKLQDLQDKELVALLKEGSTLAFEQLYLRHSGHLVNLCQRFMKNKTDAEDIVHDIFVQIWETRDTLNTELSFSGFLNTLAQNRVLQKFRKSDVHSRFIQYMLLNGTDSTNETEDDIIDNDYMKILNELIEKLPPQQKEIFRLSRFEELTHQEIAEMMNISNENVRKQVSLALKKIKQLLAQHTGLHFKAITLFLIFLS